MNNNQTQTTAVPTNDAPTRVREALTLYQEYEMGAVEHSIQTVRNSVPVVLRILLRGIFGRRQEEGAHE